MNEAVERGNRGFFWRSQSKASCRRTKWGRQPGSRSREVRTWRQSKQCQVPRQRKKSGLQMREAPGGHSRNRRLKRWFEPTGQVLLASRGRQRAPTMFVSRSDTIRAALDECGRSVHMDWTWAVKTTGPRRPDGSPLRDLGLTQGRSCRSGWTRTTEWEGTTCRTPQQHAWNPRRHRICP